MKRIMLALLASLTIAAAPAERRYSVTDFDRVRIDGPFVVELATGRPSSAMAAAGDAASLDRVAIDVEGGTLRLRLKQAALGRERVRSEGPVKVSLSTHDLRALSVNGSARVNLDGARSQRLDLLLSGSGAIVARGIETDVMSVGLLGSGRVELAGKAKTLNATVQGSGDLDGRALMVDQAELSAQSAGEIALNVRTLAKVRATGTGETMIAGSAACSLSGPGSVFCEND